MNSDLVICIYTLVPLFSLSQCSLNMDVTNLTKHSATRPIYRGNYDGLSASHVPGSVSTKESSHSPSHHVIQQRSVSTTFKRNKRRKLREDSSMAKLKDITTSRRHRHSAGQSKLFNRLFKQLNATNSTSDSQQFATVHLLTDKLPQYGMSM